MTIWILLIFLQSNGSAIETVQFNSMAECLQAQRTIKGIGQEAIRTVCLSKHR